MGSLARGAIFRGGVVDSRRLLGDPSDGAMEALLALLQSKSNDVANVAEKLLGQENLDENDFLTLYTRFDLSLLIKLVELRLKPTPLPVPDPVTLICQTKDSAPFSCPLPDGRTSSLFVVMGGQELSQSALFNQLTGIHSFIEDSNLVLVGPSLEELLVASGQTEIEGLEQILDAFRNEGVSRFRATNSFQFATLLKQFGYPITLCSPLDLFYSPRGLVRHLLELRASGVLSDKGSVWEPGLLEWNPTLRANLDLNLGLLKALALGALIFDGVVPVRASSRYFSLDALQLSHLFGATSPGVAAINASTAAGLGFLPLSAFDEFADLGRLDQCA